jgi:Transglutaminase-like superfamily
MAGVEGLPSFALDFGRPLGRRFAALGLGGYREAAAHVRRLPYGRNSDRSDWRLVLEEGRGTCSTKHALLAELARENGRPVALVLGVYEMDGENTPGVGAVLEKHGLPSVPEAHCYLAHEGARVDVTREAEAAEPIAGFLHEEEIGPGQIGAYKVEAHRGFVRRWAKERGLDPERVWRAREECIAALAE